MKPTVIIRYDENGFFSIMTDAPIDALCIDERCPSDRVYRMKVDQIDEGAMCDLLGSDAIGSRGDGSPSEARAEALVNGGKPHLEIVK